MKVLVTGAFGTVGTLILEALAKKGHQISVFEVKTKKNLHKANRYKKEIDSLFLGDIRNFENIEESIMEQEVIIHCAAIIPPQSDTNKKLCFDINVGGTKNIIDAIKKNNLSIPIVYISSASVMGPTQDRNPPITTNDRVNPTDYYSQSKVDAEKLVMESGLRYCILRLAAVMPINLFNSFQLFKLAFEIPLQARCEVVLDYDVATACVRASETLVQNNSIDNRAFFIGGGKQNGCQITAFDLYNGMFTTLGVKIPDESYFNHNLNSYYIDWYNTETAQSLLNFQNHTFDDYRTMLKKKYGFLIPIIIIFRPVVNAYIKSLSPYKNIHLKK